MTIIRYIVIILIAILLIAGGTFVITKNFLCNCALDKKENILKVESLVPSTKTESNCEIIVDVSGSVKNPGVICLPSGSVVNDAILKAGNFNTDFLAFRYVSQRINLAQKLENNQKVYIPFENETLCSMKEYEEDSSLDSIVNISSKVVDSCISLNNASREELDTLKGIGLSLADKIIGGRPFAVIDDLKNISGISDKVFEDIKGNICL